VGHFNLPVARGVRGKIAEVQRDRHREDLVVVPQWRREKLQE
jgi:hypothetical protein